MRTSRILPVVLFAMLSAAVAAQPERADFASLTELAPKLVRLQNQFEQMVPDGVSIEAREISRTGTSGKDLEVRYNIFVKGVAPDMTFGQIQWPVDQQHPMGGLRGITLNKDGEMICAGRTPEQCHNGSSLDSPVVFSAVKPLKGEPRRFAFVAGKFWIPISIVPDPVQAIDNGCKLTTIRLSARFELALIEGAGFPPNADVHLSSAKNGGKGVSVIVTDDGNVTSAPNTSEASTVKADAKGSFQVSVLQNREQVPVGTEEVQAAAAHCAPAISYTWGVF
jgi:hypothetical protein